MRIGVRACRPDCRLGLHLSKIFARFADSQPGEVSTPTRRRGWLSVDSVATQLANLKTGQPARLHKNTLDRILTGLTGGHGRASLQPVAQRAAAMPILP